MNLIMILKIDEESSLTYDKVNEAWNLVNHLNKKTYNLNDSNNLVTILKVLYKNPDAFFAEMQESIARLDLPLSLIHSFPLKELIVFCISNKMVFWIDLSIKWFSFIEIDDGFIDIIQNFSRDSRIDQNLRHKALKATRKGGGKGNESK